MCCGGWRGRLLFCRKQLANFLIVPCIPPSTFLVVRCGVRGKKACKGTYSSAVNPLRSFRSAPAQNELSTSLAKITALVGPLPSIPAAPPYTFFAGASEQSASYSEWMEEMAWCSSERRALDMAFRAEGRESVRIRMRPVCGAGRSWICGC